MEPEFRKSMRVTNETQNLSGVRQFVTEILGTTPLDSVESNKIVLAIDEAVANVIEHGYASPGEGEIDIHMIVHADRLEVRVEDEAPLFDPTTLGDADVLEHIRVGKKKGLGMFLMRRIMDEVIYTTPDRKNSLRMIKFFSSESS